MSAVLDEISLIRHESQVQELKLRTLIKKARRLGHSWEAIGEALGISRQGAMKYKRWCGE